YTMLTDEQQTLPDTQFTDDTTLLNDRLNWLQVALDRLPDKQKEVFHLREIEDMTYQDIAEVLSMSISDVKVNIHRARLKVREIILKIDAYGIAN
ncbi:MAG: RNA polymerase sigma factor, partial [Cyclobacteriaceae bacterium]